MRYSDKIADSLIRRMAMAFDAPVKHHDGTRFVPGAFVLNKGSATNGIAWGVAMVVSYSGAESAVITAATFAELVSKGNALIDGARLAARVQDVMQEAR